MSNPYDPNAANPLNDANLLLTRRRFFGLGAKTLGAGLGTLAMQSLQAKEGGIALGPHFRPKAKRVIYLHMEGAPSQLDLYDYKPGLRDRFDQDFPESIHKGQRLTTMTSGQARFPIAPSIFKFPEPVISL